MTSLNTADEADNWPCHGARVYIAAIVKDSVPPGQLELLQGVVVEVNGDSVRVDISREGIHLEHEVPIRNVFRDEHTAQKRLLAKRLYEQKKFLLALLPKLPEAYPPPIRHSNEARMCGNPLRAGEPGLAFAAQSNVWGTEDNTQKCLMIAGSIWQDIRVLFAILFLLSLASEYSKKMIGKYIVIEMQSLRRVLGRLNKLEPGYLALFKDLESKLGRLDQEFGYPTLRSKIGAHRDGDLDVVQLTQFWKKLTRYNLERHLDILATHFGEMNDLFPSEMAQYFSEPTPLPGVAPNRFGRDGNEDWEPFDPPKFSESSEF